MKKVPVLDKNKKPLMPTSPKRARKLMEKGRAKPYWCKGVFCIILQDEPKSRYTQEIGVGIDPGSKWEGFTVKSEAHTLLNIQTDAKTDVHRKMKNRKEARRTRRSRNTRNRKPRFNRKRNKGSIPPSTKARWDWKISIINWLRKMYPITTIALENIAARTIKGARKWNVRFSPLEVGKRYFRDWVKEESLDLYEFAGYDTKELRDEYGLKKNSKKSREDFYTHCVDSWVLVNEVIGGHIEVDNESVIYLSSIKKHRRRLHVQNPKKGAVRKKYGSTRSLGIERGTLVRHPKHGKALVGGTSKGRISLHSLETNKRICQNAKKEDLEILTNFKWNIRA